MIGHMAGRVTSPICVGRQAELLVLDEAFMDVGSPDASFCAEVERGRIVVLRSFGKFFGLAGLRLGFAIAAPAVLASNRPSTRIGRTVTTCQLRARSRMAQPFTIHLAPTSRDGP